MHANWIPFKYWNLRISLLKFKKIICNIFLLFMNQLLTRVFEQRNCWCDWQGITNLILIKIRQIIFSKEKIELSIKATKSYIVYALKHSIYYMFITNIECKAGLVNKKQYFSHPNVCKKRVDTSSWASSYVRKTTQNRNRKS